MNRLKSVDALRIVAIVFVIAIHSIPFENPSSPVGTSLDLATAINQIARFAVPYFFILSGYFWAEKFADEPTILEPTFRMAKRIALLFLAWSAIYLLPTNIVDSFSHGSFGPIKQIYWNVANALGRPFDTVLQGTKVHLWFLTGLLCALSISALLLRFRQKWLLVFLAVALYTVGLAGKSYSDTPMGFHADFNFRNGPFYSLLFFVTGYFLQKRKPNGTWFPAGLAIAGAGYVLQLAELVLLNQQWGTTMAQDYVIGSYFVGLGIAMMGLSNSRYLHSNRAAATGPLVLGIYASHFIFIDLLKPLDRHFAGNAAWSVLYVVAVFLLSYALVRLLSQFDASRRLVQ